MKLEFMDLTHDPGAGLYVKTAPVEVEFATAGGEVATLEGTVAYLPGDALLTGVMGERWPVGRKSFEQKYQPEGNIRMGEDGRYRPIPRPVHAKQMAAPFEIRVGSPPKPISGKAGDWLAQYDAGSYGIIANEVFRKTYVPFEASSAKAMNSPLDRIFDFIYRNFRNVLSHGAARHAYPQPPADSLVDEASLCEEISRAERLATKFSNRYRSAILINFTLGFIAVALAFLPFSNLAKVDHRTGLVLTAIEFFIILTILIVHLLGRDADHHEESWSSLFFGKLLRQPVNQGWRCQWVQARLMSEQFRYTTLLLAFPGEAIHPEFPSASGETQASIKTWKNWVTLHEVGQSPAPSSSEYIHRYIDTLIWKLEDQVAYHRNNHGRNEKILHRLHQIANWCFKLTLAACAIHLLLGILGIELSGHVPEYLEHIIKALPVLLPALAATCHGILAGGEFAKIAANSSEMAEQLKLLVAEAKELKCEEVTSALSREKLRELVNHTYQALISEVVGWHVTLRDKDVHVA